MPIAVNIFFFHLFMDRDSIPVAIVILSGLIFLIWTEKEAFLPLLKK